MNDEQIERVRRVCLALPEAAEVEAWGEPTFRVRKKMFAMFANNHHRDGRIALWCPAPVGVQQMLVRSDEQKFFVPPYVGPKGWIGISLPHVDDAELESLVVQAYGMVAPKKLLALLDAQGR
ncbi:MAG TPA: MmcQ/YjbR family DNA-binding protein [Longimicrobiaceae bacterium]|jgi:hypothetical protein|nr:MmcQ/YjbR family DNA-binding protein [Longimicrobiaceae bacterium]